VRRVNGRVVADVFIRPDTDGLGPDIARAARLDPLFRDTIVYLTCVHELGHAFGLPHTAAFADIMYSFQFGGDFAAYFLRFRERLGERDDIPGVSPFSAEDLAALRALYRERR
jgi:predicted Zn-dependent protease